MTNQFDLINSKFKILFSKRIDLYPGLERFNANNTYFKFKADKKITNKFI